MKLLLKYYLLLFIVVGCTNTGPVNVAGWNLFNRDSTITNDIEVQQLLKMDTYGARVLTEEDKARAKVKFKEGAQMVKEFFNKRTVLYGGVSLHYAAAGRKDWKGWGDADIPRTEFVTKQSKLEKAHKDLITLLFMMWQVHPTFVVMETLRDEARQKMLVDRGNSWTPASKHLRDPPEAADIVGKRRGKIDYNDTDILATYQGIAVTLGVYLETLPCEEFGSTVRRVIDWVTVRDLYHIEIVPRKECT